jgi:hypothetical protein
MRWTPLMTWLLVAAMVWLAAPISRHEPESRPKFWSITGELVLEQLMALLGGAPDRRPKGGAAFPFLARRSPLADGEAFPYAALSVQCIFKNVNVPHIPVNG